MLRSIVICILASWLALAKRVSLSFYQWLSSSFNQPTGIFITLRFERAVVLVGGWGRFELKNCIFSFILFTCNFLCSRLSSMSLLVGSIVCLMVGGFNSSRSLWLSIRLSWAFCLEFGLTELYRCFILWYRSLLKWWLRLLMSGRVISSCFAMLDLGLLFLVGLYVKRCDFFGKRMLASRSLNWSISICMAIWLTSSQLIFLES